MLISFAESRVFPVVTVRLAAELIRSQKLEAPSAPMEPREKMAILGK